jgi:P-type E1-E2 ATPase
MARYVCQVELRENARNCSSEELVPGDIVKVPQGAVLPCDMILLSGSAIINEALLTGESIPVIKESLPNLN